MKKIISILLVGSIVLTMFVLTSCSKSEDLNTNSIGTAYIYGEQHGVPMILEEEFELWNRYYHENNMRHLFVELPFYAAEYLNLWMNADNNDILDEIFTDIHGSDMDTPETKEFFIKIKQECPQTIFHGIDVGHLYKSMGNRYLNYLTENNLQNTQVFDLTEEAIKQGEKFYAKNDFEYRENMLAENFKREFDKLENQDIMGIFGSMHANLDFYITENTANMATQLVDYYKDNIVAEDLSYLAKEIVPIKIDKLIINGKEYEAEYFGNQDLSLVAEYFGNQDLPSVFTDFSHREFWKLTDAFEDFYNNQTTGNVLPVDNYPMNLELNQIYIIDYTKPDGSVIREVHRYDGKEATQQIII
ncbi:hypothetical protein AN639_00065 [Candidatus Epulonipiscium fishelsonii]|uniref:Uncharacterized protein n=2 Tax=Candidatus Epulonipiscium fishelsonii TaxID=77094 RepID=A0ACC8XCX8_9FIRM|nr:hypothetical protein AN396_05990 [Epulopiscium sp. SCG-B11WGA-EpuloA1]ONI41611.1 hypothetical protein AN396_03375 [Epulopiscium sp. SCG-B11WGA-EpuloA1]ONI43923.1 hypothetical protein AN639_00065 [Epulopiscium sp. SCG-B05WGA-EpuloA1]